MNTMGGNADLFRLLDMLNSCEFKGHDWALVWTSNSTCSTAAPKWVPRTCQRCGCQADFGDRVQE